MEVLNANAAILSNFEVLALLKDKQKQTQKGHLPPIMYKTIQYLQDSPCAEQSPEKIRQFLAAFEPFNLTKAEKLMLINNPPQKEIDLQLIVEDCGERLTEDQIQEILKITSDETAEMVVVE